MRLEITEIPDICRYCRKIMKQPDYPKTLELYRGDMLCMTVDVEGASKLVLVENAKEGPVHRKYAPMAEEKKQALRLKQARKTEASDRGCV